MLLAGLKSVLKEKFPQLEIFSTANPEKIISEIEAHEVDIAIIDLSFKNMPENTGLDICCEIKNSENKAKILVYSSHADSASYLKELLSIKVDAIVSKNDDIFSLVYALEQLLAGKTEIYSEEVYDKIALMEQNTLKYSTELTKREKEIVKLIHKGLNYRQIANQLCVSLNTIKTHVKNIFRKLKVKNKKQLIAKTSEMFDD